MTNRPTLIFSTRAYEYLQEALCAAGGFEAGAVERTEFPDGEHYRRIATACAGRDVVVVGGTISDGDTLELYDMACALSKYGARRLTLIIPYFGYSTMERATRSGEIVGAKTRARLVSSIPSAPMGNRVFLIDLHVDGITHYFENDIQPLHLYAKPIIKAALRRLGGDDFVLACTDAGRAKWVESLANDLGVTAAFVYKRRLSGERTEVAGVSAHVTGKRVVIYDDMIRTGSSLIGAAQAYKDAGAVGLAAVTSHGIFPGDSLARIEAAGLLECIVCTDTYPRARTLASDFLQVESIAPVILAALEDTP